MRRIPSIGIACHARALATVPQPAITSNGGGSTASVSVEENQTAVTTVTAIGGVTPYVFSVSGGADAAKFSINASSGVLTFALAPDFETPEDADENNVYEVVVRAENADNASVYDQQAISVTVTDSDEPVNAAPTITVPGAQSVAWDDTLTFSGGSLISIADADTDAQTVTLSADHGTLTLSGTTGLSFTTGDGTSDAAMEFSGSLANVNAALNGLIYTPDSDYAGEDTISIDTDDGNGGTDAETIAAIVTFDPSDLGPVGWYQAGPTWNFTDSGKTTPAVVDDLVYVIDDQGSGANDASQSISGSRAHLRYAAGRWHLEFDGGDFYPVSLTAESPHTKIAAVTVSSSTYNNILSSSANAWLLDSGTNKQVCNNGGSSSPSTTGATTGVPCVVEMYSDGSGIAFYFDGTADGTVGSFALGNSNTQQLGGFNGSFCFNGNVTNVLQFDRALTADERAQLTRWLQIRNSGIAITSPQAFQVFQRSGGGTATISISGTYVGSPTAIEAKWGNGAWTTIDASPSGGTYSGSLTNQASGSGTLQVRFTNLPGVSASAASVGVGDIFIGAGQSNMVGQGTNDQTYTESGGNKASLYTIGSGWSELADPTGVDMNGSYLPHIATNFLANVNYPIAFANVAVSGSAIVQWEKSAANFWDDNLDAAITGVGGSIKAVLWHQGENEAMNGNSQASYYASITQFALDINTDYGVKLVACILQNCNGITNPEEQAIRDAISQAIADGDNVLAGPDFSDMATDDLFHFTVDAKLEEAGLRWWNALNALFY